MSVTDPAAHVAMVADAATEHRTPNGIVWRAWGVGPPLLLLHGDVGSWTHWIRNIMPLGRRFRVIVPDMPGYGASAELPGPLTPENLAGALAEGLRALPDAPARYPLAGFSFGGIVAGHLAAIEAARVMRLVLLGAGGLGLPMPPLPPLQRPADGMAAAALAEVHRHNLAALMFGDASRVDALAVHVQMESVRQARTRAGGFPASDTLRRVLPRVPAHLYGIWGERDAFAAPWIGERATLLRSLRPEADVRVIPAAGHWTPYEAADAVNAMLTEMLGTPCRENPS